MELHSRTNVSTFQLNIKLLMQFDRALHSFNRDHSRERNMIAARWFRKDTSFIVDTIIIFYLEISFIL